MRLAAALLLLRAHALTTTTTGPAQPVVWSLAGSDSSAGAGVEASGHAINAGVTPQTRRNAVTPRGAAVDDRAQPQCGAPRKDMIMQP